MNDNIEFDLPPGKTFIKGDSYVNIGASTKGKAVSELIKDKIKSIESRSDRSNTVVLNKNKHGKVYGPSNHL
jgi:hypothetical protein